MTNDRKQSGEAVGTEPLRRFRPGQNYEATIMVPDDDGEWVRYEDARAYLSQPEQPALADPTFAEVADLREREAFSAGWHTNATLEQPADYLRGCEEADWGVYKKATGVDDYCNSLLRALHEEQNDQPAPAAVGEDAEPVKIAHDGFEGNVIGRYVTREGKRGVVLQQIGTRVVHVYGEKWLNTSPPPSPDVAALQADTRTNDGQVYAQDRRRDEDARIAALQAENERLTEWKAAIVDLCKALGSDDLTWGGDKSGWGFIHYFVKHLHTRAEASEALVADMREAERTAFIEGWKSSLYGTDDTPEDAWLSRLDTSKTEERS